MADRRILSARDSGQAILECALSATVMLTLVFGLIDLSRAIFVAQVIANLSGQGSSMASRGTTLANTAVAVAASSAPLDLNSNGRVIVSAVFNSNSVLKLTGQSTQGSLTATSHVGSAIGGTATVPSAAAPQLNQTVYVTEVFYRFQTITPIGNFLANSFAVATLRRRVLLTAEFQSEVHPAPPQPKKRSRTDRNPLGNFHDCSADVLGLVD